MIYTHLVIFRIKHPTHTFKIPPFLKGVWLGVLSGAGAWRNVITALTTYFDVTYHVCKNGGLQWQVVGSEIQLYILTLTLCLFSFEIIFTYF